MRRLRALVAAAALVGAAACNDANANVEPLPPLRRPTPEERAGLPLLSGAWKFTGFEYPAEDTAKVRGQVYSLVPPGEFDVTVQRLDSVGGSYVREGVTFPFTGEVRRDGIFSFITFEPGGGGAFVAGHATRDTMWIELTGFPSAGSWPPGTRAALVHAPKGPPFIRLRGYVPPPPPPVDSTRPQPAETAPAAAPPPPASAPVQPRPRPAPAPPPAPVEAPPASPVDTVSFPTSPPAQQPVQPAGRRGRRQRDTASAPPPSPAEPQLPAPPPPTVPNVPRDTIRLNPPR